MILCNKMDLYKHGWLLQRWSHIIITYTLSKLQYFVIISMHYVWYNPSQELYPQLIHSARGAGTFCAFNGRTVDIRNKLLSELKNNGRAQQPVTFVYVLDS